MDFFCVLLLSLSLKYVFLEDDMRITCLTITYFFHFPSKILYLTKHPDSTVQLFSNKHINSMSFFIHVYFSAVFFHNPAENVRDFSLYTIADGKKTYLMRI
jgi:hypothetical protein